MYINKLEKIKTYVLRVMCAWAFYSRNSNVCFFPLSLVISGGVNVHISLNVFM